MDELERFATLVDIMDRLRDPGGCPWDREQTYATLRGYLIEECYEVVEALDADDPAALREELGDLLFQIVFLARLAQEQERFSARDVVRGIAEKMIRRHPHVFADDTAESAADVLRRWEAIKREEKRGAASATVADSILAGVPRALPALLKAQRLGAKAARVGFDWERPEHVLDKVEEELLELRRGIAADAAAETFEEIGDVLFSVAMLARRLGFDPEAALEQANRKFVRRFRHVEAALARDGRDIHAAGPEQLERLWNEAKQA